MQELVDLRQDALQHVWDIVERAVGDIDKELTPEQRKTFEKLKPKPPAELSQAPKTDPKK